MESAAKLHVHAPLPDGYKPNDLADLRTYMANLMQLLKRYMLIHTSHPDRFFEIVVQKRLSRLPESLESVIRNDPSAFNEAVSEIAQLCTEFKGEFTKRGTRLERYQSGKSKESCVNEELPFTYEELPHIINRGPQNSSILKQFFDATEKLKLKRRNADFPDPVGTLFSAGTPPLQLKESLENKDLLALEGEERLRVRAALLGKGMCTKKKHEVTIMNDTIRSLLHETRKATGCSTLTVMNVGEGKGYVSRVLSICEATPVVGIDCNPHHKEVALERLEPLLDVAHASHSSKKTILNLNYCNRGRTTCVTCRVEPDTDWVNVLKSSVPIVNTEGESVSVDATFDDGDSTEPTNVTSASKTTTNFQSKVACKACGKILRCQNGAALVKHARIHTDRVQHKQTIQPQSKDGKAPFAINIAESELQFEQLSAWAVQFSPEQLAAKVQSELFTPFTPSNAPKRERADEADRGTDPSAPPKCSEFARATDLIVHDAREIVVAPSAAQRCEPDAEVSAPASPTPISERRTRRVTIVGYDDSSGRYKVFAHEGPPTADRACGVVSGKSEMMALDGPNVVSVTPLAPIPLIVHPVVAPSLSSVVLMGLHTCGDLGAAICNMYRNTSAPSMVLVSCCWHALTGTGFPLSSMLRSDPQFASNSLSLMLATQPLETFVNSSSEEHYGSTRLLFYRSMFALVWEELRIHCSPDTSLQVDSYDFSKCRPVLERSFLRSLAKDKYTMTFVEFCRRVRDELMNTPTFLGKVSNSLCSRLAEADTTGGAINLVSAKVRQFLMGDGEHPELSRYLKVAAECESTYFETNYAAFVGFTTLRTWMSHLLEGLLLMDRLLYLCETSDTHTNPALSERLSLVPLFDGLLSPRLFAILALKESNRS